MPFKTKKKFNKKIITKPTKRPIGVPTKVKYNRFRLKIFFSYPLNFFLF